MPSVDSEVVLRKLGMTVHGRSGERLISFCPDHKMFVDREPSDPNWLVNVRTGDTYCLTEGRGSNLLWTVCRLLGCGPREAVVFLTGSEEMTDAGLQIAAVKNRIAMMRVTEKRERKAVMGLEDIESDLKTRYMSDACYEFFMHPPDKPPTNIRKETVDRYRVFERTWGYYSNRAVVPFSMTGELVGFCAIDILGKKRWLTNHPLKSERDYKKTLYPANFQANECLFGYDDCSKGCELLFITEGAREVMKLWQEGFTDSVAILGGNVSDSQMRLIGSLVPKEVGLMFDGNDAGVSFTDKATAKLGHLFPVRKLFMPRGYDPKNLDKAGIEEVVKKSKRSL